ncbi:hypothetical protein ABIA39_007006 [Nocardia sp. GAS34]
MHCGDCPDFRPTVSGNPVHARSAGPDWPLRSQCRAEGRDQGTVHGHALSGAVVDGAVGDGGGSDNPQHRVQDEVGRQVPQSGVVDQFAIARASRVAPTVRVVKMSNAADRASGRRPPSAAPAAPARRRRPGRRPNLVAAGGFSSDRALQGGVVDAGKSLGFGPQGAANLGVGVRGRDADRVSARTQWWSAVGRVVVAAAGLRIGRGAQHYPGARVRVRLDEQLGDRQPGGAADVADQVGWCDAGLECDRDGFRARRGQPFVQFQGVQQVGELGLRIGRDRPVVGR